MNIDRPALTRHRIEDAEPINGSQIADGAAAGHMHGLILNGLLRG